MKYLLLAFCLIVSTLSAQTYKVKYTYNASGGRVSREIKEIELPPSRAAFNTDQDEDPPPIIEEWSKEEVKVYPNPTKGNLTIDISGTLFEESEETIEIVLYDASGRLLQRLQVESSIYQLDMTAYIEGWYLLLIRNSTEQQEFKIIKK